MSGYGNRTAEDPKFDGHDTRFGTHEDMGAYSNATEHGSGTTGGAGYGNKKDADPNLDEYDNSDLRFDSHTNTDPYSGSTEHGSGTTGGAGYGNKTGSHASKNDSTMGKLMEKVGGAMKNEGLVEKGRERRESKGYGQGEEDHTQEGV